MKHPVPLACTRGSYTIWIWVPFSWAQKTRETHLRFHGCRFFVPLDTLIDNFTHLLVYLGLMEFHGCHAAPCVWPWLAATPQKKRAKVILYYYMAGKINFKWWILQQTMPDFQSVWFSTWGKGNICDEHFPALMFTRTMFGPKATCSGTLENVLSHWPVVKWQGHLHAYCNLSIRSD